MPISFPAPMAVRTHRALLALSFLLLLSASLAAQSVIAIPPHQCLWHPGDDPRWAAPSLDESTWHPYSDWRSDAALSRLWIRCHANLASLRALAQPAAQVRLYSAYELYLNGSLLGASGNLHSGNFSVNVIRSYPIPPSLANSAPAVIALRVVDPGKRLMPGPAQRIMALGLDLRLGDARLLDAVRAGDVLTGASHYMSTFIYYGIVGVLALPLLALYLFDRSRKAILLLALAALSVSTLRLNEFAVATFASYPIALCISIVIAGNIAVCWTEFPFFFVLARGRLPRWSKFFLVLVTLSFIQMAFDSFGAGLAPVLYDPVVGRVWVLTNFAIYISMALTPFIAFWPWSTITRRMRPLAALCMFWGLMDAIWFATEATAFSLPGIPNLYAPWGNTILNARGIATACVVTALVGLLFREQRQVALERATLAGELQAAAEIQRMLAPAKIDTAPGIDIDVAFRPMREVGGDFYLCRVLPNGSQRILLGDVSGKGAAAAMAASMLLGAAEDRGNDSPAALLAHLNRVLCRAHIGGFATCLCADVHPSGEMTLANAGHLNPFRAGRELASPGCVPLGLVPDAEYAATRIPLHPGDILTFVSDGVVEARNPTGELFGFDRSAAISHLPAPAIAQAAQSFGQDDDITVLTLAFLQMTNAHSESVGAPSSDTLFRARVADEPKLG